MSESAILAGHFHATEKRLASGAWPILMLHDTTELSFHRKDVAAVGMTTRMPTRKLDGKPQHHNVCGILMHSSLAVTLDGLPLGLAAIKFWSRDKFYGCNQMKKRINPTRIPIEQKESYRWLENGRQSTALLQEPDRCVHIGDRESDIYELFCTAQSLGTHFLLRTCVDRLAGDGKHTIAAEMAEVRVQGLHRIQVQDRKGNASEAVLEIRKLSRIRVLPPINKSKQYPELLLTVIHAQERGAPKGRDRVDWKLITDLPVTSRKEAIEKLRWYSLRWKIEVFHKILKSGCKAEASKLRTANRLVNLISVLAILSWRIFWMTMMNRAAPDSAPEVAFTALEIKLLDRLVSDKLGANVRSRSLSTYLTKLARLGGYLARSSDRLQATCSSGEAYPASPIYTSASSSPREMWVIESNTGRLRCTSSGEITNSLIQDGSIPLGQLGLWQKSNFMQETLASRGRRYHSIASSVLMPGDSRAASGCVERKTSSMSRERCCTTSG